MALTRSGEGQAGSGSTLATLTLIRRSQAGDQNAFERLFHEYKNLVYKTAVLMLDSPPEAEDALQEVFLQVHKSLATYDSSKAAFTTWLHRITVNHCINRRRKRRFLFFSWDSWDEHTAAAQMGHVPSPEEGFGDDELREGLRGLSDKLRAVVILRFYHELSYAEMAQVLNVPVGTIKSRLDLALKTLRKGLSMEVVTAEALPGGEARG